MASRSWNRVELIGNLTRDPELRYTPNGAAVCTFGMATNRTFVSEGERREEADFHRLVAWNKLAELCNQLLKKGNRVFISGRLQTRSWEAADGQTKSITEIVVEDMILLTPKGNGPVSRGEDINAESPIKADGSAEQRVKEPETETKKTEAPKEAAEELKADEESVASKPAPQEEIKEDLPF